MLPLHLNQIRAVIVRNYSEGFSVVPHKYCCLMYILMLLACKKLGSGLFIGEFQLGHGGSPVCFS
jgi:hypothetical protein